MKNALMSLYYYLVNPLLFHWEIKIFKKLNREIVYLDG